MHCMQPDEISLAAKTKLAAQHTWTPKIANIMKKSSTTILTLPMAARLRVRDLKISCMPAERVSALSGLIARNTRRACSRSRYNKVKITIQDR